MSTFRIHDKWFRAPGPEPSSHSEPEPEPEPEPELDPDEKFPPMPTRQERAKWTRRGGGPKGRPPTRNTQKAGPRPKKALRRIPTDKPAVSDLEVCESCGGAKTGRIDYVYGFVHFGSQPGCLNCDAHAHRHNGAKAGPKRKYALTR